MDAFDIVVTVLRAILRDRQRLVLENLALRQRVGFLRRRWSLGDGGVHGRRALGGLHHVYSRAA